jgi:hypothetical protein
MSAPLNPLRVVITHGEQVQVKELADPREGFCKEFNEQWKEFGMHARPDHDIVRVVLLDPDDPNFMEPVGPPVRRETADLAKKLYDEAIADHRDRLEMYIIG